MRPARQSYLGFQLQRVNGWCRARRPAAGLLAAAEDHRVAAGRWSEIVGDVRVDWALEHHEEITAAAHARCATTSRASAASPSAWRSARRPGRRPRPGVGRAAGPGSATSAPARRASRSSSTTRSPGCGHGKPALLELLSARAGTPQPILLTDDEDVACWARLEALAGELTILEPSSDGGGGSPLLTVPVPGC